MSSGVVALIGSIKPRTAIRSVESLARTFNMPYITPTAPPSSSSYMSTTWSPTAPLPPSMLSGRNRTSPAAVTAGGGSGAISDAFTLYLRPPYRTAIIDLVRHYGWRKVYYIYDNSEGMIDVSFNSWCD
jgi:hypothetical protein